MYRRMKPKVLIKILKISKEFMERVFYDIQTYIKMYSEPINGEIVDIQTYHEDLVNSYMLLMKSIYTVKELSISKRVAQPGSWYDIMDYHCINFYPISEVSEKITGVRVDELKNIEYTQDHILFEYIDKYLYTTEREAYQNFPPLKEVSNLIKIFSMLINILSYSENIEKLCTVFTDLSDRKLYPGIYTIGDIGKLKSADFDTIKSERALSEPFLGLLSSQVHFKFLVSLWKEINLSYESFQTDSDKLNEKYEFFMNLKFFPLSNSSFKSRIKNLPEFSPLDISQTVTADDLTETSMREEAKQPEENKEETKEEIKEQTQEEVKQQPQEEDDWEAEEDRAFLGNFAQNLESLIPKDDGVAQPAKEEIKEDTRVFTGLETILQIRNAIKYFILDTKPIEEVTTLLKAVHEENLKHTEILKRITRLYDIPNLNSNSKNMINRWMYKNLKRKTSFISRDYFLSCIKDPVTELRAVDKQRYAMLLSALLIEDLKDEKLQLRPKNIRTIIQASGGSMEDNSLFLSLISDPYTLQKFDSGTWATTVSDMLKEVDGFYTDKDVDHNVGIEGTDLGGLFGDEDDY